MILGGLADDLTGGLELAAMLVAEGVPTVLATSAQALGQADRGATGSGLGSQVGRSVGRSAGSTANGAVVIAQKTRIAPVAEARQRTEEAARALLDRGARQLFFKYCATFDSTPVGNIGPCIDVLLAATGSRFTACCPTFPEYRRTVYQGHLFVGDRLVSESPKRLDPVTPMTDPDLVRVLTPQTRERVGLIDLDTVRAGAAAITERVRQLQESGIGCAIADAATHADLRALAQATVDWPLMTGGSSLAAHYPALWRQQGLLADENGDGNGDGKRARHLADELEASAGVTLPPVTGPGVVLAGSCADQTREQLARFGARHPVLALDVDAALRGEDVAGPAIAWARARMDAGPVALATSATPEIVERLQARVGVAAVAACCEGLLGRIAAGLRAAGARRFVIAGGETSGAVLSHLNIDRVAVGPFAAASLPLALDVSAGSHATDPLVVCLKSGKLAGPDAFVVALDRMAQGGIPGVAS